VAKRRENAVFSVDLDHRLGSSCTGLRVQASRRGAAVRFGSLAVPGRRDRSGYQRELKGTAE
jgi:hypothetical protein